MAEKAGLTGAVAGLDDPAKRINSSRSSRGQQGEPSYQETERKLPPGVTREFNVFPKDRLEEIRRKQEGPPRFTRDFNFEFPEDRLEETRKKVREKRRVREEQ